MATEPKTRTLTAYRVLKFPDPPQQNTASNSHSSGMKDVGGTQAINANAAIKTIAEKAGPGRYVAVPESSWKPVEVTVETQTVIKVG